MDATTEIQQPVSSATTALATFTVVLATICAAVAAWLALPAADAGSGRVPVTQTQAHRPAPAMHMPRMRMDGRSMAGMNMAR